MKIKKALIFLSLFLSVSASIHSSLAEDSLFGSRRFIRIADRIKPSVVNIIITHPKEADKGRTRLLLHRLIGEQKVNEIEDFLSYVLFREFPNRIRVEKMVGSGIIIRPDGLILTNQHVVDRQGSLEVVLSDGRSFPARIVGKDYLIDLALIQIEAEKLPVVTFGDSDELRVGEWVLAIGNSLGLEYTVSAGIVSAKGRDLFEDGIRPYTGMIQTDAPLNLGNSGGPLVDMKGKVVGLNTTVIPKGQSLGFAIPINDVKEILPGLIEKGEIRRTWLGVGVQPERTNGHLLIYHIVPDSPAHRSGLRPGDRLLSIDDTPVMTREELYKTLQQYRIGTRVTLSVEREGEILPFRVRLELMPIPELTARKVYPPGIEGFLLRLPERTRWLLIFGTGLFLVLLIKVKHNMERKKVRAVPRRDDRRGGERRSNVIPLDKIRVRYNRRQGERRHGDRREEPKEKRWFRIS